MVLRPQTTLVIGMLGAAVGVLALGAETVVALGSDESFHTTAVRDLIGLSLIALLSAILINAVRLTRIFEEEPTRVQPILDAFLIGAGLRGVSQPQPTRDHTTTVAPHKRGDDF